MLGIWLRSTFLKPKLSWGSECKTEAELVTWRNPTSPLAHRGQPGKHRTEGCHGNQGAPTPLLHSRRSEAQPSPRKWVKTMKSTHYSYGTTENARQVWVHCTFDEHEHRVKTGSMKTTSSSSHWRNRGQEPRSWLAGHTSHLRSQSREQLSEDQASRSGFLLLSPFHSNFARTQSGTETQVQCRIGNSIISHSGVGLSVLAAVAVLGSLEELTKCFLLEWQRACEKHTGNLGSSSDNKGPFSQNEYLHLSALTT